MILYQDSDSIVKRYLRDEGGVEDTRRAVEESDFVATTLIAYPEVRAALARARRANRIRDPDEYSRFIRDFNADWRNFFKIAVSSSLARQAGELADRHALKGYDSVHLAAAVALRSRVPDEIKVSTWDKALAAAAIIESLSLAHEVNS